MTIKKILLRTDLLLLVFLLFALFGFRTVYHRKYNSPPIRSDGVGYYAYLPSYILFHDLSFQSLAPVLQKHGYTEKPEVPGWTGIKPFGPTRRLLDKYPVGEAIMILPFFLAGHGLTLLTGGVADGFSNIYQYAAGLAGLFYGILGLFFLKKILARHFSPGVVAATLACIFLGTNLYHYLTYDSIFSHAFSFCALTGLLIVIPRFYAAPAWRTSILLGALAGLIVLIRLPNALSLLAIPLFGLSDKAAWKIRLGWLRSHSARILAAALTAAIVVSAQLLIWKISAGQWFLFPYQGEAFRLLTPKIIDALFSVRKGLFFWSPMLLFSIAGLGLMRRRLKEYFPVVVIVLASSAYLISSWETWWFGGSFGHRVFVDYYGFFALPMACLFSAIRHRPARTLLTAVAVFLIILSLVQTIQYWRGIIPFDQTTWEHYRTVFLRL